MASAIEAEKRALRLRMRGLGGPPSDRQSLAAQQHVLDLLTGLRASCVALYRALSYEVPTEWLFEQLSASGVECLFPRLRGADLTLHRIGALAELAPGSRGLMEPRAGAPAVEPGAVAAFVVPGVCFDRFGGRLGRGGGHYDRLLAAAGARPIRVGLCCAKRLVERVPLADGDARMHVVVTECGSVHVAPQTGLE